jgi:signal transduction histidine kinase
LFFNSYLYRKAMERMNRRLELQVERRTSELVKANRSLRGEVEVRKEQDRLLRKLASELILAEARERRTIAGDLHDHIGQALALARQKLQRLHGNAVFSGSEKEIETTQALIEQIIKYTRTLTVELSPPVLYELGLGPALASLAEQFNKKHHLPVIIRNNALPSDINDDIRITLYTAARELLTNVVKHANAKQAILSVGLKDGNIVITVADDGAGCPSLPVACDGAGFGLFSIRERLKHFGGLLSIESLPGRGTTVTVVMPRQQQPGKI